jgi:hypothetical protein
MAAAENSGPEHGPRPRVGRPFVKGRSGNPGGRPKKVKELVELARAETRPTFQKIVWLRDHADDQRVQLSAAQEILNRAWGKPSQPLSGDPERQIRHRHDLDLSQLCDEHLAALEALAASDPASGDPVGLLGEDG